MEALKKGRRPLRAQLTRLTTDIDTLCATIPIDRDMLRVKFQLLLDANRALREYDQKVADQMVNDAVDDDGQDQEFIQIEDYQTKAQLARIKVEHELDQGRPTSPAPSQTSYTTAEDTKKRSFKLPKIELRKFNGQLKDWLQFWSQFEKIHDDDSLHDSDKISYLLQAIEPGTEARELVESYPQSGENYMEIVAALKEKYGDEDLLLQVYVRELLKLVVSNVSSKEKIPFQHLYLKLESYLRALKTLKLEDADPATWLYPLVESSLSEEILLAWQRSPKSREDGAQLNPPKTRLDMLMEFLKVEVQIKQKISLAQTGFEEHYGQTDQSKKYEKKKGKNDNSNLPTLASCHISDSFACAFCDKRHETKDCHAALSMSLEEKREKLRNKNCCHQCLKPGHIAKKCRSFVKCFICDKRHQTVMCPEKKASSMANTETKTDDNEEETTSDMANHISSGDVVLQTLMVTVKGNGKMKTVRAFMDNGSQRSYILKTTAGELGLSPVGQQRVSHSLFGGTKTAVIQHNKYQLELQQPGGKYKCKVNVWDQAQICNTIPRVSPRTPGLIEELKNKRLWISDLGDDNPPIELLLGVDVWATLLTGKVTPLTNGLTAVETKLGWTLCGEPHEKTNSQLSMCVLSMNVQESSISDLWNLEAIGIKDPVEVKSQAQIDDEAKEDLCKTMVRLEDGRYEVGLPWSRGHPPLPTNRIVAEKRLASTTKKLFEANLFSTYEQLLIDWEKESFIERVPEQEMGNQSHYLPHRPVIKPDSLTTPIRIVFDCSCRTGKSPSLNDCLQKGVNYVQLIPEVFLRFREGNVGITSDIRKAFQTIEVKKSDRDTLRFLWWEDCNRRKILVYRHKRVVFGATCSPFILGAVLEAHLKNVEGEGSSTAQQLLESMYVDNCVTSTTTYKEYEVFKEISTAIMKSAQMELRMWMTNQDEDMSDGVIQSVLGYKWNRKEDTISVDISIDPAPEIVTKRSILSAVSKIFDPLGIVAPAVIPMKILLQEAWISKAKWDQPLSEEVSSKFLKWYADIKSLATVRVPRMITDGTNDRRTWSLHTMTDSSKSAFASVIFLRIQHEDNASVYMVAAKARVAPLKKITIPRLELLGCLIGCRLAQMVKKSLKLENIEEHYWSDSSTAIAWIKRDSQWATFVGNRVAEINKFTNAADWHHVPGNQNPADLPSRGCYPTELRESSWWEGPTWLKKRRDDWPSAAAEVDEEEIVAEMKKSILKSTAFTVLDDLRREYTFSQTVRITGWILRFVTNSRVKKIQRREGPLNAEELKNAESALIKSIQLECFPDEEKVEGVKVIRDKNGLLRVKTKIIYREDLVDFLWPVLLPKKHRLVDKLIKETHEQNCHAGLGFMMCKLREKFWILQSRRAIKMVIGKCYRCRRLAAKKAVPEEAPLPLDRIRDADVFEVVGIDLAGPLFLRNGSKVWVVVFTCAIFRAVHLELVSSLSTRAFIGAMKTFVYKYGRPAVIFTDNGTNFVGASRLFKSLDWEKITLDEKLKPITWRFNPPTAAWWGGFWERIIRTMKDLMKRMIGKATLTKDELTEVLKAIETTMNGRPLTYVSDDPEDLVPLTPSMFLKPVGRVLFPEGQISENEKLRIRMKYVEQLKDELKQRFRKEYLSQMVNRRHNKTTRPLEVGELVLIGSDNRKRMDWPMGRIMEIFPGKDGISRVAKVKTQSGEWLRPFQRLYPLEMHYYKSESDKCINDVVKTKCGRIVKAPDKLML